MKKNAWVILAALSTLLILTGCSSNSSEHKSSASSKAELVKSSSNKKKHSEKEKTTSSKKESSTSSVSSEESSSSSTQSSEDMGEDRGGYVTTPEAMRGTWYSYFNGNMDKLVVSEYEMTFTYNLGKEESTRHIILYKNLVNKSLDNNASETEKESKKDWYSGWYEDYNGIKFLRIRGMFEQGPGDHFSTHEEEINGQKVPLVLYGFGANDATDLVYYPSEDLAKQQSDVKYGDIDYKF